MKADALTPRDLAATKRPLSTRTGGGGATVRQSVGFSLVFNLKSPFSVEIGVAKESLLRSDRFQIEKTSQFERYLRVSVETSFR